MRKSPSVALVFIAVLLLVLVPFRAGLAESVQYQLTINPAVGGTTIPPPGNYSYSSGTNVTIAAVPDPGYIFDYWTNGFGQFMGSANPMVQTLYSNLTLQPLFENISSAQRVLTINAVANGTTDPLPGNYTYDYGTNVTVTAVPDSGYIFDYWIGGYGNVMGGANPITIVMDYNTTLQPVFESAASAKRTLTILVGSNGTTNPPAGNYTYAYGENVTVTAIPDSGYIFTQWIGPFGNLMGFQNPDTLMMTWNLTIQPVFENASTAQRTLTIDAATGGTTDPPPGNYTYAYMANVTVTAIPDSGYMFDHWMMGSGGSSGNQNPFKVMMNWNFTIQPVFENATSGPRTLTIMNVQNGTTVPPPGTYTYDYGENVTVTAIPQNGTYFGGWFLDNTNAGTSNPITITMDSSHQLGAKFTPTRLPTVVLTINPATGGTTTPAPGQYTYAPMGQVTVTAISDSDWWLDHWLLDGNIAGNSTAIQVDLYGNHTVRPVFASNLHPASFMLAINAADGGTTNPMPGTYTYDYGTNVTITATPNGGQSFEHWLLDGQTVSENPITVQMIDDHTLQPVFTGGQGSSGQGGPGVSLNVPPMFILGPAMVVIACCFVGYLVPLGLAIRKGKVPPSVKKPRLILALASMLIVVGPLGATLLLYSGNLSGVFTPSNADKLANMLSTQGGIGMPNVTSSWCNLTSRTFGLLFNFTNPTATDLTLIACSANLTDPSDSYPLGPITLANPVTASANETVTFQMTGTLANGAAEHLATAHAGASSLDVDLSSLNVDLAGIMVQMNETSTVNNVSILR